jgi:hypothetical protein
VENEALNTLKKQGYQFACLKLDSEAIHRPNWGIVSSALVLKRLVG